MLAPLKFIEIHLMIPVDIPAATLVSDNLRVRLHKVLHETGELGNIAGVVVISRKHVILLFTEDNAVAEKRSL